MEHRRLAWLVTAPLLAAAAAMLLGAVVASTAVVVMTPYAEPIDTISGAGHALLATRLADMDTLELLVPALAALVVADLAWLVGLGLGAQTLFPARRRLIPVLGTVLLGAAGSWAAVGALASRGDAAGLTLGSAASALVAASAAAGVLVFLLAGDRWHTAAPVPRPKRPAVRPVHLADLL